MTNFIKNGASASCEYHTGGTDDEVKSKSIVPLAVYMELANRDGDIGVWLDADEEVETVSAYLQNIPVVALNFPVFSDGRSYSSANILRQKYAFTGEIRAIGDVRIDQLEQMARCGFDAFELNDDQDIEQAVGRFKGFSFSYQNTVDREPLFRQR
jgi:uncharacterized protein (DUF934 family)